MPEHITYELDDQGAWLCICGNDASDAGFFPINDQDQEVEPTPKDWQTNQYCCGRCGRVIDQDTLEVVRQVNLAAITRLA